MNYQKEQESIQDLIVNLSCYLHHNRTFEFMRETRKEVSSKYVENATFALSLMEDTKRNAKAKIQKLLPIISEIMEHEEDIKGENYHQRENTEI